VSDMLPGLVATGPNQTSFIDKFRADAMAGTLPQVSYIVPQDEITEHPPNPPRDGGWQQKQIIDALVNSPSYKNTVMFITYDGKHSFISKFTGFDLCLFH
jgi:phospholipase C